MERNGVYIDKGPQDYEIIQRNEKNCADVCLEGHYVLLGHEGKVRVFVRILEENSGGEIRSYTECDVDGNRWSIELKGIPGGGLYKIETGLTIDMSPSAHLDWNMRGDMRHFIGVGDVYVIAGQSNSAGYGKGIAEDCPELGVQVLRNSGQWSIATHPLCDGTDGKFPLCLEGSNNGNSPYLMFGKLLKKELGVPIGLVPTALGASPLKRWNPLQEGDLYQNMLEITQQLTNGYKGVLWYQGCSDTNEIDDARLYGKHFEDMVNRWKKDANNEKLVFLTCQLNKYLAPVSAEVDCNWGIVREAQRVAADKINNCYVVPTSDMPLSDGIHNSAAANILLGERVARVALWQVYQGKTKFAAASLQQVIARESDVIQLIFKDQSGMLDGFSCAPEKLDFIIEDENGINKVKAYSFTAESNILQLERAIAGDCFISCGARGNIVNFVPVDLGTYMPILCFCHVKAETDHVSNEGDK